MKEWKAEPGVQAETDAKSDDDFLDETETEPEIRNTSSARKETEYDSSCATYIPDEVGKTPLFKILPFTNEKIHLYVKLEYCNPTGSVKDRAASYILNYIKANKIIDEQTTIIESSSGNMGISLAAYCNRLKLKFICVIDPHILKANESILSDYKAEIIKVDASDVNGGYLITRLEKVNELMNSIPNSYWINQYGNPLNAQAYYLTLGEEMCRDVKKIDYVFLGVSSCGTITGVSKKIKEKFPDATIVAVDIKGSVIFGGEPEKRYIPGIGSSKVPEILKEALIDDVVVVTEEDSIESCYSLLDTYNVFIGGSSGSVISAIKQYFKNKELKKIVNVVTVFADKGERYKNTIYNKEWIINIFGEALNDRINKNRE